MVSFRTDVVLGSAPSPIPESSRLLFLSSAISNMVRKIAASFSPFQPIPLTKLKNLESCTGGPEQGCVLALSWGGGCLWLTA